MIASTMTALAVIFLLSPQVGMALQAVTSIPSEAELVDPATSTPAVTEPVLDISDPADMTEEDMLIAFEESLEEDAGTPPVIDALPLPVTIEETDTPPTTIIETAAPTQPEVIVVETTPIPQPALTEAERTAILGNIKTALAAAKTAKGKFIQSNADGSASNGEFALRRPGKVRFDYADPNPILIVSDGTTVAMEDSELETIDRIPLGSTPLGLILDDDLDFSNDVDVLRVNQNAEKVWLTVEDKTGELEGELTMVFALATYDLLGWMTIDANLQMTTVELIEVETNGRIDPRLFRLNEAEDEEDER